LEIVSVAGFWSQPLCFTQICTDSSTPFSFMNGGTFSGVIWKGTMLSFEPWK